MRSAIIILAGLSISMLLAAPVCADSIEIAKVYRAYPAYINPAVCDNPNLEPSPAVTPAGMPPQPATAAGQSGPCASVPYAFSSDDPINVPYLALWAGMVATHDNDVDYAGDKATISFDNGFGGGAAVGYDFGPARLEIEGSYRESNADEIENDQATFDADGDLEVRALLVNAYADFTTGSMVTPYLGAGIGYAEIEVGSRDDEVFAGQLAAGMLIALSPAVAIDLGYRFMMTDNPEIDDVEFEEVKQHTAVLGLQIRF